MTDSCRPNLLFIFADEQAVQTMKAYGQQDIETPNMDRLAEESILFEHAYVTQPVCTPSRSSLLTGLYPHTNGCTENNRPLPSDVPCFPELGDFDDYETAYFGKWHLGDEIFAQHGFEHWRSIDDSYYAHYTPGRDRGARSSYANFLAAHGQQPDICNEHGMEGFSREFAARLPEELSKPAYVAQESCRFIRTHKEDPFMLFVNFFEPHMPYFSPRDGQYDPDQVPLPPNFEHELDESHPLKTRLFRRAYAEYGHSGLPLKTPDDWRRLIANYWGLVSLVDTYLGQILDTVNQCGLDDDTIIVFTSDHGDMMGAHRLLAKCVMFEEAVKVPLLLKLPTLEARRVSEPVSQIDLVPTLLEAMGQDVPDQLQGYSWLPFLHGEQGLTESDVFIEWNGGNSGFGDVIGGVKILDCWREMANDAAIERVLRDPVRTVITPEGWKYNRSSLGEDELYCLRSDPYEMNNLVASPQLQPWIEELQGRICRWQLRTRDHPCRT